MWIEQSEKYLKAIVNKDLKLMEDIFSDDINLYAWNIHAKGKTKAIEANKIHLDLVESTKIDIVNITHKEKYVCIETVLTHRYKCDVADVFDSVIRGKGTATTTGIMFTIQFNDVKKIKSIKTYKLK